MAGRPKNPECITSPVSVSLPVYMRKAIRGDKLGRSQSLIVREAVIKYLNLTPPPEYADQLPKTRRKI